MDIQSKRVVPPKKVPEHYPSGAFTESSIRYLIFNAKFNGYSRCLIRLGKKVLIDLDQMDKWLEEQRG
jgi:hypothetical protein